jgi:pyruvate dehydrogenase complex dehydrogenase (E1) component
MQEMQDVDPVETRAWLDALGSVVRRLTSGLAGLAKQRKVMS